ncbi:MAG: hypothetical protein KAS32_11745 [Candidatus Peribacteraceae bacterium]|nr:hypothetical protein [Candidatus Peribacteraceae bacterium]
MNKTRTITELAYDACTIASWTKLSGIVGLVVSEDEMVLLNEHAGGTCTHLHGVRVCVSVQDLYQALTEHSLSIGGLEEEAGCIHGWPSWFSWCRRWHLNGEKE